MHIDVRDLQTFYKSNLLGHMVQRVLSDRLAQLCSPLPGQTVVGFGYAVPLLKPYLKISRRVIALMPGQQGAAAWPPVEDKEVLKKSEEAFRTIQGAEHRYKNISVLCDEVAWPLSTGFVDRLIILHAIEASGNLNGVMAEMSRVLRPGGRAIVVLPNRSGLWAQYDNTPFGYGRPYSFRQLEMYLRKYNLVCEQRMTALYAPPYKSRFWLRSASFWERFGMHIPWLIGGILVVVLSRQHLAPTSSNVAKQKSRDIFGGSIRPVSVPQAK